MAASDANDELVERAGELSRYHEIWWQLVNRENEAAYRPVLETYETYFETTTHALLQGFSIIVYQLFERRRDSYSIAWLLGELKSAFPVPVAAVRAEIEQHKPLLAKVFSLRNKVYAHRSTSAPPESVFAEVGITPNEMRKVVALVQRAVAELVPCNDGRSSAELQEIFTTHASIARAETEALLVSLHRDER
jgi:hypothetical protein